jgi:protein SCO1/2
LATGLAAVILTTSSARAQLSPEKTPPEIEGITIDQKIDAQLSLDLWFKDSRGRSVQLSEYFKGDKPVILTLNYYRCPMLCTLTLSGMVEALQQVELDPATDFEVVTVSFDPLEDPKLAKSKKSSYVAEYGHPKAALGWHFLTGSQESIKQLTNAVGFRFRWNASRNEWAHSSALIMITPKGRVSRYLGGVTFDPKVVRLSLVEASQGKIGGLADQIFLTCFQWTDSTAQYTPYVAGILRVSAAVTVIVLAILIATLWRVEVGRRRRHAQTAGQSPNAPVEN